MASQNDREQRRAARLRGAGTHKVDLAFTIQPLAPSAGAQSAVAPLAPPPRPPQKEPTPQAPTQEVPTPELPTPKQRAPAAESSSRRLTRSAMKDNGPVPELLGNVDIGEGRRGPLARSATTSSHTSIPETQIPRMNGNSFSRRISKRTIMTPILPQETPSAFGSAASQIDTPTHISGIRSTRSSRSAVAAVTPVTRGKRTRQPSPDKFLTTPEVREMEQGRRARGAPGRESERDLQPDEGDQSGVMEDTFVSQGGNGEVVAALSSPDNGNKRRKVLLEEAEVLVIESTPESESGSEPQSEPEPESASELAVLEEIEAISEPEEEIQAQQPRRKRQIEGKKPASPLLLPGDEDEEEEEVFGDSDDELEFDFDTVMADESDEEEEKEPLPPPTRKKPAKPDKTPAVKQKQRSRQRREEDAEQDEEEAALFPVTVHRLNKVEGFTLQRGSQRSGVNAIDVINQVFMEVIDRFFAKLKSSAEKKAVENFKEELGVRFVELTDALETNIALTTRVRQAQKQKAQLRSELLRLKQEREEVAVKIDDVRKTHEIATASSNKQQLLSTAFENISGTVERAKARQASAALDGADVPMEGLDALLRKVSAVVTGGGNDGGGLLAKVVEFNKFLEKAETALRERAT